MLITALVFLSSGDEELEGPLGIGGKGGNQNHRSSEWDGWSDEELKGEFDRPARTKEEKARKDRIKTELKGRKLRNKKKRQENNFTSDPNSLPVPVRSPERQRRSNTGSASYPDRASEAAAAGSAAVAAYWIISEASRLLFPPRNLIPVP